MQPLLSILASSASAVCSYPDFWCAIKDFQTLVSASVALVGVVGAIFGVLLKARLDRLSDERKSRSLRSQTAAAMCALITAERNYFPETSLFRLAREADLKGLVANSDRMALALKDYIDYFTKFVSSLSSFPPPISDRASFMAWISARLAFSMSAIRAAPIEERDKLIAKKASEVRLLFAAAIATIDAIHDELTLYTQFPAVYERHWRKNPDVSFLIYKGRGYTTTSFDVQTLKERVVDGLRQMESHDASMRLYEKQSQAKTAEAEPRA